VARHAELLWSKPAYRRAARAQRLRQRSQQFDRTHRQGGRNGAVRFLQGTLEYVPSLNREPPMKNERPDKDAELATHEPLRIVFALAALLLGFIAAMH